MQYNDDTESVAKGRNRIMRFCSTYTWAGEIRNAYSILIWKSGSKTHLEDHGIDGKRALV
jgi:hypothetical protein